MQDALESIMSIVITIISAAFVASIALTITLNVHQLEISSEQTNTYVKVLEEEREWRRYVGAGKNIVTGADVVDFITRHKYSCDIVISDSSFSTEIQPYITDNRLLMGITSTFPDSYWTITYAYKYIINGKGDRKYTAELLYDGELSPIGSGSTITGIYFQAN